MRNTFFSYSFGCRVNEAEKEEIDRQMLEAGFHYSPENPSIYIINTCSVTHKAERETRQHIYQVRRKFPASKIIITGCSATYWKKNNLIGNLPADEICDNLEKEYLVKLLQKRLGIKEGTARQKKLNNVTSYLERQDMLESKFFSSGRLLVKIQDGCQRYCTFCIVPYLRGKPKSIKIKDLGIKIKEYENKIKEVILTAINTEAFGYDTGETFIDLVQSVIDETKIPRISFGSIHPWTINDSFFSFYKKVLPKRRLIDFFHIPLQSGSNKILQLMKRGYTREEMMEKMHAIKRLNDFVFIGTDIIAGFLDETEKDFEDTYNFLNEAPISKFHIFRFSKRQNTAAYYLAKRLQEAPYHIKHERAKKLAELGMKKYQLFLRKHLNKVFSALFLNNKADGFQEVLLSNQIPAFIKVDKDYVTELKDVKITEFKKGKLFGTIV